MASSAQDDPFFLLLTYSEVHTPDASPEEYLVQYDQFLTDESREEPWRYYMDWADKPSRGKGEYYANVSYMDAQMGRVLDSLRQSDRLDDTLVIFSSEMGRSPMIRRKPGNSIWWVRPGASEAGNATCLKVASGFRA